MSDLLDDVLAAHGGLKRWQQVRSVTAVVRSWGLTWTGKGQPGLFGGVHVTAQTGTQAVSVHPFTDATARGFYTPDRVWIESADATILQNRHQPRDAFAGHNRQTPWDHLHGLYFGGYALWNYFNLPFLAALPDVDAQEIDPWHEGPAQDWRRLRLTFPPHIHTHCPVMDLHIDNDGLIVRLDYAPEVIGGGTAAHYLYDYAEYDGFMFPGTRKVVPRLADNRAVVPPEPESLLIGIEFPEGYVLA
ncbi:hypothetical protein AWC29_04590 [Mycobacterium triplex]|uniref:Uncharacterized protein n=1 Tax=Mycobacterium triplex TaxID=47839 RepID=A0A024K1X9_9MYCO|nr:hypothetical protein [Mycobacterium triplex]ORW98674.1 hypothetical protein AWC29_04590 [Mycobacterium triplex]CDO90070.1 hypothetical protein BN973_04461 [Mycobacterium triplex]